MQPEKKGSSEMELTIFQVGELLCGLENHRVREISGNRTVTTVHHAPAHVRGVVNLRGQIMTVIDLGLRFGIGAVPENKKTRVLVVRAGQEDVGMIVDGVEDVILASRSDLEPPPSNIAGIPGSFFRAILKSKDDLIAIVDLDRILDDPE